MPGNRLFCPGFVQDLSKGMSKPALSRNLSALHALFALAGRMEWRDTNPVARAKAPKCDDRAPVMLSDDQLDALLWECGENTTLRLFVLVLADAGLRCESEALWLRWEDVKDGALEIISGRDGHRTKAGRGRRVPISARLAAALRAYAAENRLGGGPCVFHKPVTGERIKSLRRSFMAAAKRAKLPDGFHRHDLRHRCCTRLLESGANVADVTQFMGHADLATTQRYLHASGGHVERLRQMVG
jgi:integrase/recombinase XerC